ncbi:hypothetical protein QBC38DRAFT_441656 [Podospora fimiseda]|uniref:Uncharacterized protein n=1 Tax=Podospora fimiseda TaxID=252190 RepID=A0AAN7BU09_9PEZI|nr:hypothetical protein QBC38DRAFT_441656 [Podospora fimiseda]
MFGKSAKKTTTKPQKKPSQPTTVQQSQPQQVIETILIRRTTWQKLKTTTTRASHQTAKAAIKVIPLRRKTPGTGENQTFYRASYASLSPQQKWDLYLAGLAPSGVAVPSRPPPPSNLPPKQYKTVPVMYLTRAGPTGVKAEQIKVLPSAAQVAKAKQQKKKNEEDSLPSFPTPQQGIKVVQKPVKTTGSGQKMVLVQPVKKVGQAQQRPTQTVKVSVPVQQQQQQQYVTVQVPVQIPVQQQQQQRVQLQTVRVQPQQQVQQQYVVVQQGQQIRQQQVRLSQSQQQQQQQILLVPGQARPRVVVAPGTGRRVAGQSVVVVRA